MKSITLMVVAFAMVSLAMGNPILEPIFIYKTAGGTGMDECLGLDYSGANPLTLLTTGYFNGSMDYGTSNGAEDIFAARTLVNLEHFNASFDIYSTPFTAGGPGSDKGQDILCYGSLAYLTGYFSSTASFGEWNVTSAGAGDAFVCELDFGNPNPAVWIATGGGLGPDDGTTLAIDSSGGLYVAGHFSDTAVFGDIGLTSAGDKDIFVAKLDSQGNWLWVIRAGGIGEDRVTRMKVDSAGNCLLTGSIRNSADFGQFAVTSVGGADAFVAKIDGNGNWLWVTTAGGIGNDVANDFYTDSQNITHLTGACQGVATFGPYVLTGVNTIQDYVAKINQDGVWTDASLCFGNTEGIGIFKLGDHDVIANSSGFGWNYFHNATMRRYKLVDTVSWDTPVLVCGSFHDVFQYSYFDGPMYSAGEEDIIFGMILIPEGFSPVELSGFTATATCLDGVQLTWTVQSETQMLGYRVYRNTTSEQHNSLLITPVLIPATNTSSTHNYHYNDRELEPGQTYYYWLEGVDQSTSQFYGPVSVTVEQNSVPDLPEISALHDPYPNPFHKTGSVNIPVTLRAGDKGSLRIMNLRGQILQEFDLNEGVHTLIWDGFDRNGVECGNGLYYIRMSTPSLTSTRRIVKLH